MLLLNIDIKDLKDNLRQILIDTNQIMKLYETN